MAPPINLANGDLIDEAWVDGVVTELAALPGRYAPLPTAWVNVTYQNGHIDMGAPYQPTQYRKNGDRVEVRGAFKTGGAGTVVFTLPAGFRPPSDLIFPIISNGAASSVTVAVAGTVTLSGSASTAYSVVNIQFSTVA